MGTEISLDVAQIGLISSKNHMGLDHGSLFQEKDRKRLPSEQINYEYFENHREDPGPMEMAFVRPLREVIPRLEMLGFTLPFVRAEYERSSAASREHHEMLVEMDIPAPRIQELPFDEFRAFALEHPVTSLDGKYIQLENRDDEARIIHGRYHDDARVARIPHYSPDNDSFWSERSYFGGLINILHPYAVLRLLGESEANHDAEVVWQYGPLVEAGWAQTEDFVAGARRTETFLVATEGSSDVYILKHAPELLKPEIADFFRFIDVTESHPFSGAGNLVKFAEGLAKIDVHNQVVFLFDNDAEGFDACQRVGDLQLPINMCTIMLPELEDFRAFLARGPDGIGKTDINRRAAGIECYLDLRSCSDPPMVHWSSYKERVKLYQGALENKESYLKQCLNQTSAIIVAGTYDVRKLRAVLATLQERCSQMRVQIESLKDPFELERDQ